MSTYSLSHLSDATLERDLATLVTRDCATTATLLAHLAEFDARKLYLPAAYPSMYAYCVGKLHMSEDAAYKRIRAARAARRFPAVLAAVAHGRVNLSGVVLLAPHLTPENAEGILAAATHNTNTGIERMLAERFPRPDVPTQVQPLATSRGADQLAVRPVATNAGPSDGLSPGLLAPAELSAPGRMNVQVARTRVTPLAPERFALQVTIGQHTHDKLRYAQALLGHHVPASDVAAVLDRALDALIHQLEKRKFAATAKPRRGRRRGTANVRHIPAEVRRAVWERDGGQCTFVSETGQRCPARERLEFDHVHEVARGGEATISGIRLRCRAHNQYGAERTFGAEFMRHKRLAAAAARAAAKARAVAAARVAAKARAVAAAREQTAVAAAPAAHSEAAATAQAHEGDVVPWLRALGAPGSAPRPLETVSADHMTRLE